LRRPAAAAGRRKDEGDERGDEFHPSIRSVPGNKRQLKLTKNWLMMRRLFASIPPLVFVIAVFASHPAFAQWFLGTIRGTVVDPQGQVVQGAAVLITDEATGVVRTLETDAEFEVVTQSFKKFERTGVVRRVSRRAGPRTRSARRAWARIRRRRCSRPSSRRTTSPTCS
jgi:hypothetical protein